MPTQYRRDSAGTGFQRGRSFAARGLMAANESPQEFARLLD